MKTKEGNGCGACVRLHTAVLVDENAINQPFFFFVLGVFFVGIAESPDLVCGVKDKTVDRHSDKQVPSD